MFKYSVNVIWSDEDQGFIATIPEFNNLSAYGETQEEAVAEAKKAAEGYIEVMKEDGVKIPEPEKLSKFSGQIRLRMPTDLHQKLALESKNQGVSLNAFMNYLLSLNYGSYKEKQICSERHIVLRHVREGEMETSYALDPINFFFENIAAKEEGSNDYENYLVTNFKSMRR